MSIFRVHDYHCSSRIVFYHKHNASFDVMLVCTFEATFFIFAKSSHMIKIEALVTLCDVTILFKQFA